MKLILRLFTSRISNSQLFDLALAVASEIGREKVFFVLNEFATAKGEKRHSDQDVRHEIDCSGGIAGRFQTGDVSCSFTLSKPPAAELFRYVPVGDFRLIGDRKIVEKMALDLALKVLVIVEWDYGFACDSKLDDGILPAPYGYSIGIPRVFWANFLGKNFVQLIGRERIGNCAASVTNFGPEGQCILIGHDSSQVFASLDCEPVNRFVASIGRRFFVPVSHWFRHPAVARVFPSLLQRFLSAKRYPKTPRKEEQKWRSKRGQEQKGSWVDS